jgi:hypothetical protein
MHNEVDVLAVNKVTGTIITKALKTNYSGEVGPHHLKIS